MGQEREGRTYGPVFTTLGIDGSFSDAILPRAHQLVQEQGHKNPRDLLVNRELQKKRRHELGRNNRFPQPLHLLELSNIRENGRAGRSPAGSQGKSSRPHPAYNTGTRGSPRQQISSCKPRTTRTGPQRPPVYLFTDEFCDPGSPSRFDTNAACGVAMFDPEGLSIETFGQDIPEAVAQTLSARKETSNKPWAGRSSPLPREQTA